MYLLLRRLLPFAFVLGGVVLLVIALPVIIRGAETSPTPVAINDVAAGQPPQRWLHVTGGGVVLPQAIMDEQINKTTGAKKIKAWYVPLMTEADAARAAPTTAATGAVGGKAILVKFAPDEYLSRFPMPEQLTAADAFRPLDIDGVRSGNTFLPQRLKDFVRAELNLPLDNVIVIDFGAKPLQRGVAVVMAAVAFGLMAIGIVWGAKRLSGPRTRRPLAV